MPQEEFRDALGTGENYYCVARHSARLYPCGHRAPDHGLPVSSPINKSQSHFFWLALLAASTGATLCVWAVKHFIRYGEGTPAPWDPPKKLVIGGPYRHSRNPMITGALLLLLAEALFLRSWFIAAWMLLFFAGNVIYFPLVEEKGLEKRFGEEYRKYKSRVPRWIPRLKPWENSER